MLAEIAAYGLAAFMTLAPPVAMAPFAWNASRAPSEAVGYQRDERAVTNWRGQAAVHLDLDPSIAKAFAEGGDPRSVPRCVKLNNYWCIKGVGWNGMLAADSEGHAAFASAPDGAAVAALLLRRYYLDFARRSAQAIVSRWAPAQCGFVASPSPVRTTKLGKAFGVAQRRGTMGPDPGTRPTPLATRGLQNTLRARYLASRGRIAVKRATYKVEQASTRARYFAQAPRRSVVADRPLPALRTPVIAAGLGAMETPITPTTSFSLALLASRVTPTSFPAVTSCAGDGVRIRNYAMKVIEGVTNSPDEDLKLFEPDGTPTENLSKVMANMAGVEIGPLKADPMLVKAGIETATAAMRLAAQARAAAEAEAAPGR